MIDLLKKLREQHFVLVTETNGLKDRAYRLSDSDKISDDDKALAIQVLTNEIQILESETKHVLTAIENQRLRIKAHTKNVNIKQNTLQSETKPAYIRVAILETLEILRQTGDALPLTSYTVNIHEELPATVTLNVLKDVYAITFNPELTGTPALEQKVKLTRTETVTTTVFDLRLENKKNKKLRG